MTTATQSKKKIDLETKKFIQKFSFLKYAAQFVFVVLIFSSFAFGQKQAVSKLEQMNWLVGCFENKTEKQTSEEAWTKAKGGMIFGVGRVFTGDKTIGFEFMRIHEEGEDLFFTSIPSGQKEASFKLVSLNASEVVFENPTHDFPQKIIYRKMPNLAIAARIEGKIGDKFKAIDFSFTRTKCE